MTRDQLMQVATSLHRKREFAHAIKLYREVIQRFPPDADATHLIGVAYLDLSEFDVAEKWLRRALKKNDKNSTFHYHLALALNKQGKPRQAIASLNSATKLNPYDIRSLQLLGNVFMSLGRWADALEALGQALSIMPAAETYSDRSVALQRLSRLDEALTSVNMALEMNRQFVPALINKSLILHQLGELNRAIAVLDEAVRINARFPQVVSNRGALLLEAARFSDAANDLRAAVELDSRSVSAYVNLGTALLELRKPEAALQASIAAIDIASTSPQAHYNRAMALRDLRRLPASIAAFDTATELDPGFEQAYWEKGVACLSMMDFAQGWPLYDRRKKKQISSDRPRYRSDKEVSTLLVWGEQGLGDEVFFSAALRDVASLAPTVFVQVDARLVALIQRAYPKLNVMSSAEMVNESTYDAYIHIGSIYAALSKIDALTQRDNHRSLIADAEKSKDFRMRLLGRKTTLCGLSWRSQNAPYSEAKSMSLEDMMPIFGRRDVVYVSLQYGDVSAEIAQFKAKTGIEIVEFESVDNFNDLDGHAALIDACDYVVSVSNTTAHIAGALGKRGYIALPYARGMFFYWVPRDENSQSYWYPSLRLFDQGRDGDWTTVTRAIAESIQ